MSESNSPNESDASAVGQAGIIGAYQLPMVATLDEATERGIGTVIQQGNTALNELSTAILLEVKEDLDLRDLASSVTKSILSRFRNVIAEELVKQAPRSADAARCGEAMADAIHRGITGLVEDGTVLLQVPSDEWLRERLPKSHSRARSKFRCGIGWISGKRWPAAKRP